MDEDEFGEPGFHLPHPFINLGVSLCMWAAIIWGVRRVLK